MNAMYSNFLKCTAIFGEWLENPLAFGAFEGEKLIGYVEGSMEGWNNRFRISNICVFDHSSSNNGLKCRKPVFMRVSGICFIK